MSKIINLNDYKNKKKNIVKNIIHKTDNKYLNAWNNLTVEEKIKMQQLLEE